MTRLETAVASSRRVVRPLACLALLAIGAGGALAGEAPPEEGTEVDLADELLTISLTLRSAGGYLYEAYLPLELENADDATVRSSILIGTAQAVDALVAGANLLGDSPDADHPMVSEALQGFVGARAGLELFGAGLALGDEAAAADGLRAFETALETARLGQPLFDGSSMNVLGERVDDAVAALHLLGPGRASALALLGEALTWRDDPDAVMTQVASIAELTAGERSMLGLSGFDGEALLQLLDDAEALAALDEIAADPGPFMDMAVAIHLHQQTIELGGELVRLGEMLGVPFETGQDPTIPVEGEEEMGDCPHLCDADECSLAAMGVGTGGNAGHQKRDPDEVEDLEMAFELVTELAEAYVSSGFKLKALTASKTLKTLAKQLAEGNDGNAVTYLLNLQKGVNPSFWIKIKYRCCRDEECTDWHFWPFSWTSYMRRALSDEETSDWIEIPPANTTSGWSGMHKQQIARALAWMIPKKVGDECKDVCQ